MLASLLRLIARRLLWIAPTLAVVSALAFYLLSTALAEASDSAASQTAAQLPRFLNPQPRDVRWKAARLMMQLNEPHAASDARAQLARLGGAALPFVLPQMETLGPKDRERVAVALGPIAVRMGLGAEDELSDGPSAVLFWQRFWHDRSMDFNPTVVRRLVRRLSQRSLEARHAEVTQLDTYALPELMRALPHQVTDTNREAAESLTDLAARMTGNPWHIARGSSAVDATILVRRWHGWWSSNRANYTVLSGAERLTATVTQTRFGIWVADAIRHRLGLTKQGRPVLAELKDRAPITLWLLLCGSGIGYVIGMLAGYWCTVRRRKATLWVAVCALTAACVPPAALALALGHPSGTTGSLTVATAIPALAAAILATLYQRRTALIRLHSNQAVSDDAVTFRNVSTIVISLFPTHLPALWGATLVTEVAFSLEGLGQQTLRALASGDIAWLMAVALTMVMTAALAQIASDGLLPLLAPQPNRKHRASLETTP